MAVPSTPAAPGPAVHVHGCVRCGKPVPLDVAMCEDCNPLGLSQPASTQVHGTVFLAVGLAIVVMAVFARLAVSGIGPFPAAVRDVVPSSGGLTITLTVTNSGTKTGSTTCQIRRSGSGGGGVIVQSPHIDPGQTVTFRTTTESFGTKRLPLAVACDTP
jgi:predicted nucleic acid-binding Zn ribbon protein